MCHVFFIASTKMSKIHVRSYRMIILIIRLVKICADYCVDVWRNMDEG